MAETIQQAAFVALTAMHKREHFAIDRARDLLERDFGISAEDATGVIRAWLHALSDRAMEKEDSTSPR